MPVANETANWRCPRVRQACCKTSSNLSRKPDDGEPPDRLACESNSSGSDPCRYTSTQRLAGSIIQVSVTPRATYSAILFFSVAIASVGERSSTTMSGQVGRNLACCLVDQGPTLTGTMSSNLALSNEPGSNRSSYRHAADSTHVRRPPIHLRYRDTPNPWYSSKNARTSS